PLPAAQQQQWQEYLWQQQFPHCLSGTVPCDVSSNNQIEIMPALLSQQVRQYINQNHSRMQEVPVCYQQQSGGQRYGEQQCPDWYGSATTCAVPITRPSGM